MRKKQAEANCRREGGVEGGGRADQGVRACVRACVRASKHACERASKRARMRAKGEGDGEGRMGGLDLCLWEWGGWGRGGLTGSPEYSNNSNIILSL